MLQIGIIGCGKITQVRHIPEYRTNKKASIKGLYDINQDRAQALADEYNVKSYTTVEEMLADPQIDAVSVCTANHVHAQMTIAALKAGKHVLCEKPMAMTLKECEDMVNTSRETGKFLMIGHNQRLIRTHAKARDLIQAGAIGDIISFETNFCHQGPETWSVDPGSSVWFFDKETAVLGAMADLGIHKTDLIQFLTGQKIIETTAYLGTLDKRDATGELIGVDDNAFCIYRLERGAIGTMRASWTCYGEEDNSTILYGTKGVMKIYQNVNYSIAIENRDNERTYYDIDQIQTNDKQTQSGVIDLFIEAIDTNTPPKISGSDALSAMRAVFASVQSSKEGKTIRINQEAN